MDPKKKTSGVLEWSADRLPVSCSECGHRTHVELSRLGRVDRCPSCGERFRAKAVKSLVPALPETLQRLLIRCPHCDAEYLTGVARLGNKATCTRCGERFRLRVEEGRAAAAMIDAASAYVHVACPHCDADYTVKREKLGRTSRCGSCGQRFRVESRRGGGARRGRRRSLAPEPPRRAGPSSAEGGEDVKASPATGRGEPRSTAREPEKPHAREPNPPEIEPAVPADPSASREDEDTEVSSPGVLEPDSRSAPAAEAHGDPEPAPDARRAGEPDRSDAQEDAESVSDPVSPAYESEPPADAEARPASQDEPRPAPRATPPAAAAVNGEAEKTPPGSSEGPPEPEKESAAERIAPSPAPAAPPEPTEPEPLADTDREPETEIEPETETAEPHSADAGPADPLSPESAESREQADAPASTPAESAAPVGEPRRRHDSVGVDETNRCEDLFGPPDADRPDHEADTSDDTLAPPASIGQPTNGAPVSRHQPSGLNRHHAPPPPSTRGDHASETPDASPVAPSPLTPAAPPDAAYPSEPGRAEPLIHDFAPPPEPARPVPPPPPLQELPDRAAPAPKEETPAPAPEPLPNPPASEAPSDPDAASSSAPPGTNAEGRAASIDSPRILRAHTGPVFSVALHAASGLAVSGGVDQTLRLWDLDAAACRETLDAGEALIWALAVSPDGRTLAAAREARPITLRSLPDGRPLPIDIREEGVQSLCFSPDGGRLLTGGRDGAIRLWSLESGECLQAFTGHTEKATALTFAGTGPDAPPLSASWDGTVRLWDPHTGRPRAVLHSHDGRLAAVQADAAGRIAVSGGDDHVLRVWNLETTRRLREMTGHTGRINAVGLSADGAIAASAGDDGVRLWHTPTGRCLHVLGDHQSWVSDLALSPDARLLLTASWDKTLHLYRLTDQQDDEPRGRP